MRAWFIVCLLFWVCSAAAEPPGRFCSSTKWGQSHCIRPQHFVHDTCNAIRIFADRHGLDRDFFARLIWQESRFDPNALSPADARGIAQFIPSTARLRGLKDPYNPADALEHSAQYLAEMTRRYGNEGLAAIGYNGGERRAEGFLRGRGLATETIDYVPIVTGLRAETWRDDPPQKHDMRLSASEDFLPACYALGRYRRITALTPPEPAIKPWGVQVAFSTIKAQARAKAKTRTRSCESVTGAEEMQLVYKKNRRAGKQGYFFAQYGRSDRRTAQRLCDGLRAAGCICLVVNN